MIQNESKFHPPYTLCRVLGSRIHPCLRPDMIANAKLTRFRTADKLPPGRCPVKLQSQDMIQTDACDHIGTAWC